MEDIGKLAILVWQRKSVPKKTKNPQNGKSGGFKALFPIHIATSVKIKFKECSFLS